MGKIKIIVKGILIIVFLYILIFSIQNFYQGYHDVDIVFNFGRNKGVLDINTGGQIIDMENTYLRGVSRMTYSFVWLCLDLLLAIIVGYLWRNNDRKTN